jgi:hypothetical protein
LTTTPRLESDDMEIAPGYTIGCWKQLDLATETSRDWGTAIEIFEARIRRRILDPVDLLIAHEAKKPRGTFGFAIMAIDCLVIETLQRFIEGRIESGENGRLFKAFLSKRLAEHFNDGVDRNSKAHRFYQRCRCALHHSGQTDGELRLRRTGPMIQFTEKNRIVVNRTAFHETIKCEFHWYIGQLAIGNDPLRENFRKKMDEICGIQTINVRRES